MTAMQSIRAGQRRIILAITLVVALITAAHVAIEAAITAEWQWESAAVSAGTGVLVILVAVLYLRAVARERRREVVEHMLLELLSTPRNIADTASETVATLIAYRVANAALVAIVDDGGAPVRPLAARGYPRGWAELAPPARLDDLVGEGDPRVTRPRTADPWVEATSADVGKRPWVARIPLRTGDDVIGVVVLVARRPGVLRDRVVLELLERHLSAAFDHAALYEAAYERERSLEDLELRRREFMAAIAHEIRTPLTSIQAFADLLQMGQAEMDETARGLVQSLGQGVQRLSSMVNDLIDLGRSGDAGYATESRPVDLGEVARAADATLRPAVVLRRQSVRLDLPERGPMVLSDPRIVEQVVLNLLSNANRHASEGGTIEVVARQLDRNTVRLEVSDDGTGIPEAERERIFQPYYRVQDATNVPGSGLGLAVARRLLEESGGRIWAAESDSGGARFCVEFRAAHP